MPMMNLNHFEKKRLKGWKIHRLAGCKVGNQELLRRASAKQADVEDQPEVETIKRDRSKVNNFINECKAMLDRQSTSTYDPINPETIPNSTNIKTPDLPEIEKEDKLDCEIRERKDRLELLANELEQDNLDVEISNCR